MGSMTTITMIASTITEIQTAASTDLSPPSS
jgi:hypothetical protein